MTFPILEGKVAIVTGAAMGMGEATAKLFAEAGANVAVADFNVEQGERVVTAIQTAGGNATFVPVDISKAHEVERMVADTVAAYGRLDVAVNNAALTPDDKLASDFDEDYCATSSFRSVAKSDRTMPREEDAAREIVLSLDRALRRRVVFSSESLTDHLTQNAVRVSPLERVGVLTGDLPSGAQRRVHEIVRTYLANHPAAIQRQALARVEGAGFERIRFGWAGSTQPGVPHYYRLQGPTFVLEFDNSRNSGTHIHSVWRDFERDFGRHLL